jgi:hypothetical protein
MEVSYYLKRPKAKTDTIIFARISYDGYQLKYYIGEKIHPRNWNKDTKKAKESQSFKEYPEFNTRLKNIAGGIRTVYRRFMNDHLNRVPTPTELKELLDKEIRKKDDTDPGASFLAFYQGLIDQTRAGIRLNPKTGKPFAPGTLKAYITTQNHLLNFQKKTGKKIEFNNIDLEFYSDFTEFLIKVEKHATNTVGRQIRTLKAVLNEATERGINKNISYRSKRFTSIKEKTDSIYLNAEELQQIEALDLADDKRLDKVRDLFLVGCYTGLRYSDFSTLKPEQIKEGFIEITQTKTGDPVIIPVHYTVKKIIKKYKGQLPPSISNQKTNAYLKDLGKKIPSLNMPFAKYRTKAGVRISGKEDGTDFKKWELLTTHSARRSFASNEYLAGTPSITIMAITGHKSEAAFLKYIKLTPSEHAKLLKDHWTKRQSTLKAV